MVNQLDTSALDPGSFQSIRDAQVSQALQGQKVQAGSIANAQAAALYGTQALTAAAASGDPAIWQAAKQHVAQMGMDTSALSDDVGVGSQQIQALRSAQYNSNPLVAALGLGIKAQQADAASAGVNGTMAPTGPVNPVTGAPMALPGAAALPAAPQAAPQPTPPAAAPAAPVAIPAGQQLPNDPTSALPQVDASPRNPGMTLPGAAAAPAAPAAAPQTMTMPAGVPDAVMAAARMRAINQIGPITPNANPKTQKDWNDQINALVNQDPAVLQAQKQADAAGTAFGTNQANNIDTAQKAQELQNRLVQNLQALKTLNPNTPSGDTEPVVNFFSKNIGARLPGANSGNANAAVAQWNQVGMQQTLSEMQQFAAANPGSRISQTLEKMYQKAAGIDITDSVKGRDAAINSALNEVANQNTSAQNLAADATGQPTQPYKPIVPNAQFQPGQIFDSPSMGKVVFKGGDPSDKNNYMKVGQ